MKFIMSLIFFIGFISFNACDLLRFSKFEVISWTPGGGYHHNPEEIIISLSFSRDPDKESVERNFSLTGDGNRIKGNFFWNGKKMIFSPLSALDVNTGYSINLSADAHDTGGLSMDEVFYADFTTRPDNERPVLVSFFPAMYQEVSDPRAEIILNFSMPVNLKTLYENIFFNPSMPGLWRLEDEGKTAVFTPAEPWVKTSRYEFNISATLKNYKGMELGNDFKSVFSTKTDHEIPYLLYAQRISKNGEINELKTGGGYTGAEHTLTENFDLEKDDKIIFVFSEPVDSNTVKNSVYTDNGPNFFMETISGFHSEIIFKLENYNYGSRFTLRIKPGIKDISDNESAAEYIYYFYSNGGYSKPPELIGFRMPMSPGNKEDQKLAYYGIDSLFSIIPITNENYPSGENINTWIELYFSAAEGASVDLFSVMELFRVETSNNVITFSPRYVKSGNFTVLEPHAGLEDLQRIEISGYLINSTFFGIVNFIIAAGLKDDIGNKNENSFRISVIK